MELKIPRYRNSWNEMCRQTVEVEPETEYVLTAEARMSLYPLSYGAYLGVRTDDGAVLRDRLFLLARDNMTPMRVEFNSGDNTRLTVFCGAWCDCNAIFEAGNFSLRKKQ